MKKRGLLVACSLLLVTTTGFTASVSKAVIPQSLEIQNNGKEEYFYTALQLMLMDGDQFYSNWETVDNSLKMQYQAEADRLIAKLIEVYESSTTTNSDIGEVTLSYYDFIDEFRANLIHPIVLDDGGIDYTIPILADQYFTYMPTRAITSQSSKQYKFRPHQQTDEKGYCRYGDAYVVALGSYYGSEIGTVYEVKFADGQEILVTLGDQKADAHTDATNRYADASMVFDGSRGNVLEFIMDDEAPQFINLSYVDRMNAIGAVIKNDFPTDVISIKKVGTVDVVF